MGALKSTFGLNTPNGGVSDQAAVGFGFQ